MKVIRFSYLVFLTILIFCFSLGVYGEEEVSEDGGGKVKEWKLPGQGAGPIVVNPYDGSLWLCLHQTWNLVAIDGSGGSVILNVPFNLKKREEHHLDSSGMRIPRVPLEITPTSLGFTSDGSVGFIVGEPLSEGSIATGVVQVFDPKTGEKIGELEVEGACNAVFVEGKEDVYIACGMQYGYPGLVYKLRWDGVGKSLKVMGRAETGKIPWALTVYEGNLYVTDLELQWTAQADGSMGPPYGAWVWVYDAGTLEFKNKVWVGINPSVLVRIPQGVLVGCSGSKQTEGRYEPALVYLRGPEASESEYVFIGSAGASDVAASADGRCVLVSLADFAPAPPFSQIAQWSELLRGAVPEARRWVYTGKMALIDVSRLSEDVEEGDGEGGNEYVPEAIEVVRGGHIRRVAMSSDGSVVYALVVNDASGEEMLISFPFDVLLEGKPLISFEQ